MTVDCGGHLDTSMGNGGLTADVVDRERNSSRPGIHWYALEHHRLHRSVSDSALNERECRRISRECCWFGTTVMKSYIRGGNWHLPLAFGEPSSVPLY